MGYVDSLTELAQVARVAGERAFALVGIPSSATPWVASTLLILGAVVLHAARGRWSR